MKLEKTTPGAGGHGRSGALSLYSGITPWQALSSGDALARRHPGRCEGPVFSLERWKQQQIPRDALDDSALEDACTKWACNVRLKR